MAGLRSYLNPYVHSTIYNFHAQLEGSDLDFNAPQGKEEIAKQVARLKQIAKAMEAKERQLLGDQDVETFVNELFYNRSQYPSHLLAVLREEKTREMFIDRFDIPVEILEKMNKRLAQAVQTHIYEDEGIRKIPRDKATDILVNMMSRLEGNRYARAGSHFFDLRSVDAQLERAQKSFGVEFAEHYSKNVKGVLRSQSGKINKVVKSFLIEETLKHYKDLTPNEEGFIYLKERFLAKIKEEEKNGHKFASDFTPEDYINTVIKNLRERLKGNILDDKKKVAGEFGESFFMEAFASARGMDIDIEVTGNFSEEKVRERYYKERDKIFENVGDVATTHHDPKKFSQTDLIITNSAGAQFRVQSKNYMSVYTKNLQASAETGIPALYEIQGSKKYTDLIAAFEEKGSTAFSEQTKANLSYLLANELWFNQVGDLATGRRHRRRYKEPQTEQNRLGLQYVVRQVDRLLTQGLAEYLGIVVSESLDGTVEVAAEQSNSFFLLNNTTLVPSSDIIYAVIEGLQNMVRTQFSVQATLNPTSSGWAYRDAKAFYEAKRDSVAALDPSLNYTDASLVAVGATLGESIIDGLGIERINLNTDLFSFMGSAMHF